MTTKDQYILIGAILVTVVSMTLLGSYAGCEEMKKEIMETSISLTPKYLTDEKLLNAIIKIESNNNPKAYNKSSGAVGLMQLTPIVYSDICGLTKEQAFEPARNIACGDLFFSSLMKKFNNNAIKALTFYNNGYNVRNERYATKVLKEGKDE